MIYTPRTFLQILGDMIVRLTSTTPLTDVNPGSVWTTMLEAAAQEDDEQYFQMLQIIRNFSLDTTSGSDLDDRAAEYNLTRRAAQNASTKVTVTDTAFTRVPTTIYSGLPGPLTGAFAVNGVIATNFPANGSIIVGRGTPNLETVVYDSITVNVGYVTFNLNAGTPLANDHGIGESVILSQGGIRYIPAGTSVLVPASDSGAQVNFTVDVNPDDISGWPILDGEHQITDVPVTATTAGTSANVPIGAINRFGSPPFATATVLNPSRVTNGSDIETDQELRDRIKNYIQSLSRGTERAIESGLVGLVSEAENKRIVSVTIIEPTVPAEVVKVYIDDGTGFIASFENAGIEVFNAALGGEKFQTVNNTPVVKATCISQNSSPFALVGNEVLHFQVGGEQESVTFSSADFSVPGAATAQEIVEAFNPRSNLAEARKTLDGRVRIFSRKNFEDQIQVLTGIEAAPLQANLKLNFSLDLKSSLNVYRIRNNEVVLLNKDGETGSLESGGVEPFDFSLVQVLCLVMDGKVLDPKTIYFVPGDFAAPAIGTADEVAAVLARLSGLDAGVSSGDTRVRLTSITSDNLASKVRVIEKFQKAFNEEAAVLVDRTTEFGSGASNVTMFAANFDYVYLGHSDVPFESVYVNMGTPANTTLAPTFEYWNGSAWITLLVVDGTLGFQQNGLMSFGAPYDWAKVLVGVDSASRYWIRIQRNQAVVITPPIESRVKISSANEELLFSEVEAVGFNKDYTFNRFSGDIEFEDQLLAGDVITIGTLRTKAFSLAGSAQTYNIPNGSTLTLKVDGAAFKTVTFVNADFSNPAAATAFEVAAKINSSIPEVTASVESFKVKIETNTWVDGSIEITGGTANVGILDFPLTLETGYYPSIPSILSINEPYVFDANMSIVAIIDRDTAGTFSVPCSKLGTLTSFVSNQVVLDSSLNTVFPNAADIVGFDFLYTSGALSGTRKSIQSYVPGTGTITFTVAAGAAPTGTETYQILPVSAVQVVRLWNNTIITSLSTRASIQVAGGGTKVQISSLSPGEDYSVQVSGGTGNTILQFPTYIVRGVDGYKYFTGLAQLAQHTVDGLDSDPDNFPGIKAAGVQVEIIEPVAKTVAINLTVVTEQGVVISSISNDIKSAIIGYVNNLPVGGDIIIADLIVVVKGVSGVFDVSIISPASNLVVASNELCRITESGIVIG